MIQYFGPQGLGKSLDKFDFEREDCCGFIWEVRVPGTDCEESFELDENRCETLTEAVKRVEPRYEDLGLTTEQAARVFLGLKLILGTGVPIEEGRYDEDDEGEDAGEENNE